MHQEKKNLCAFLRLTVCRQYYHAQHGYQPLSFND